MAVLAAPLESPSAQARALEGSSLGADDNEIVFPSWEAAMAAAEEAEEQARRERVQELDAIRMGQAKVDDRQAAVQLVDEVEDVLQRVGSGTRIDDVNDEYRAAYRALA